MLNILLYIMDQYSVYLHQLRSLDLIIHHVMPKIIEDPLTVIFNLIQGAYHCLVCLQWHPILRLFTTKNIAHLNNLTYKSKTHWQSVDAHYQKGEGGVSPWVLLWNVANTLFMIVCIQLPSRIPMMQDQKSFMRCWLSCSGWGREYGCRVIG